MSFKTCVDCVALRADFEGAMNLSYYEKPLLGGLLDEVCEVSEFIPKVKALLKKRGRKVPQWMVDADDNAC